MARRPVHLRGHADIPEVLRKARLQKVYGGNGIETLELNLRDHPLPIESAGYDLIILCETLEHLNFNPLPVIAQVNRVLRRGALFYVALPNLACTDNRIRLLRGESIHNPIQDFFAQLDPNDNMIVGLHWREYTAGEVKEMLERMGFVHAP